MPTYRKHLKHSAAIRPEIYMLEDDPAVADLLGVDSASNMEMLLGHFHELLRALDSQSRVVVLIRHGVGGGPGQSLRATAQQLGISISQVRRAERRAVEQLVSHRAV